MCASMHAYTHTLYIMWDISACISSQLSYIEHLFTNEKASLTSSMLISKPPSRSQMKSTEALGRAVSGRWASGVHQDHHHISSL